jgi:hypothetical protein
LTFSDSYVELLRVMLAAARFLALAELDAAYLA